MVVVSGLPRSGTSMMMNMLEAGGLSVLTDGVRSADDDNPKGYFELERVKQLGSDADRSWVGDGRGQVIKVISHLLRDLPDENFYRVILMRRDLDEVLASQQRMLERRGEPNPVEDERARDLFERHLIGIRLFMAEQRNFEGMEVSYAEALADPAAIAAGVRRFLGGSLDAGKMAEAVDRELYRNRKAREA